MSTQVIHDAEMHRQHVRLKIPITIEIDGTRFTVDDWSMGGFGVGSDITSRQPGERFPARLIFPFEDFEVSLRAECQMVHLADDKSRFGCRFTTMSDGQVKLFRYLVDAYLSGELVSAGDVLSVAGRDGPDAPRPRDTDLAGAEPGGLWRRVQTIGGIALGVLALAALAAAAWWGVDRRYLTVRAQSAVIETPTFPIRAPIAGTLTHAELDAIVMPEAPLGQVAPEDGEARTLQSPCTCVLDGWRIAAGQFVQAGDTVALLVSAEDPLTVRARVSLDEALRLEPGDRASIEVPGRPGRVPARVGAIDVRLDLAGTADVPATGGTVSVRVVPERPLDFEDLGSLVRVTFR